MKWWNLRLQSRSCSVPFCRAIWCISCDEMMQITR